MTGSVLAYEGLPALQKGRADIAASTQEFQARQAPFVRASTRAELFEVVVAGGTNSVAGQFRQRNTATALPGKAQELRQVLTEWVTWERDNAATMGLLVQVDGPVGTFIMNRWFDDLAGLEAYRANRPPERRAFMARRDALLVAPASIAILEAVVPNA